MNANMKKTLAVGSVTALVIGILMFVILTLHSCGGGGSDNGTPVYDENGNCLENCGNGDGYVSSSDNGQPSGDTPPTYADGKPIPQPDAEPYVCPAKESAPEICFLDLKSKCITADEAAPSQTLCGSSEDGLKGKNCYCYGPYAYEGQTCTTQKQCQQIPPDAWPPCVCWDVLPCTLMAYEWDCGNGTGLDVYAISEENGYCKVVPNGYEGSATYFQPGGSLQRPPNGVAEEKITLDESGSQIQIEENGVLQFTCTKVAPE